MRRIETEDGPRYEVMGILYTEEEYDRKFLAENLARDGDSLVQFKALASDALAVHPSQIKEAREDARRKGLGDVDFGADGRPVFTSREKRKAYMKAYGFYDRAGGYGDAHRGSYTGEREPLDHAVDPAAVAMLYAGARPPKG